MSISQIAKSLKVSRPTVRKYLQRTFEECQAMTLRLNRRKWKLDNYQDWVLAWLEEYPHLSASQIKDWLLERYPSLSIGDSTVRLYVNDLRERYQIPKQVKPRHYQAVPELPMGKQMQVDWGETRQKTTFGKTMKLYFMTFVLSHSRFKYVIWLDRPFRISDMIEGHEQAFAYFGGRSEEIVYDQDRLIAVSENAGNYILTAAFQTYVQEKGFRVELCRPADPESKGKVERVVQYVKNNFADSRIYSDLENWNERCLRWLERTGNYKVHEITKKRPVDAFSLEKEHLIPVSTSDIEYATSVVSISRKVRKDNTICFEGNRYSLPLGSYQHYIHNDVTLLVSKQQIQICHPQTRVLISSHSRSYQKGELIQDPHHRHPPSATSKLMKEALDHYFEDHQAHCFFEAISEKYPRHARDQFKVLQQLVSDNPNDALQAIHYCHHRQLISANDVRDVATMLKTRATRKASDKGTASSISINQRYHIVERDLSPYLGLLSGGGS